MISIIPTTKLCGNCQKILPVDEFYRRNDRKSYTSKCKSCFAAYRAINKEKLSVSKNAWEGKNREKVSGYKKSWVEKHREQRRAWERAHYANNREKILHRKNLGVKNLSDSYIANKLRISRSIAPTALIETKRVQLMIYRHIKENK